MTGELAGAGSLDAAVAQIWAQSEQIMRDRIAALEDAAGAVLAGELSTEQRRHAEQEAHKLAGSLGSFGLAEGSQLARDVEWLLRGDRPVEGADALRFSELVVALGNRLAAGPPAAQPAPAAAADDHQDDTPSVLLVDADQELAHRMVEEAMSRRLRLVAVSSAAAARERLAAARPELVVVDPANCGESDGGRAFLDELRQTTEPVPVVVLTAPGGKVDRPEAARLRSRAYLEKPVPPRTVVEVVGRVLRPAGPAPTVLVVGDSSAAAAAIEARRPRGLRVETLTDQSQFWVTLQRVRPDLLVLDVGEPQRESVRLCRMVRGDVVWGQLPVMVSTDAAEDLRTELFRAGADDVVLQPAPAEELVVRVVNRLERSGSRGGGTDPGGGLAGWPQWQLDLRRLLAMAGRYGHPVAVAVLAVDDPAGPAADDPAGPPPSLLLGRVLRRSLRFEDAVGERGDRQLVAALYGINPPEAVERLAGIIETFRGEQAARTVGRPAPTPPGGPARPLTASVGVATYPMDGGRVEDLVERATRALRDAQAEGGDRVLMVAGDTSPAEHVDVLLVDDDETLGPLLIHALTTRGYRTHWLRDGAEAAATLLAPDGLRAGVVLLDVGLPGLDGLSVLRELANGGTLAHSRVIMLTLRASEDEVLEALELGAFDHVAKPVSVPLLLRWVRRAMESLR